MFLNPYRVWIDDDAGAAYGAVMISSIVGLGFMIDNACWQLRPTSTVGGMITMAMIGWVSTVLRLDGSAACRWTLGVKAAASLL